jgi:hypothetical protein
MPPCRSSVVVAVVEVGDVGVGVDQRAVLVGVGVDGARIHDRVGAVVVGVVVAVAVVVDEGLVAVVVGVVGADDEGHARGHDDERSGRVERTGESPPTARPSTRLVVPSTRPLTRVMAAGLTWSRLAVTQLSTPQHRQAATTSTAPRRSSGSPVQPRAMPDTTAAPASKTVMPLSMRAATPARSRTIERPTGSRTLVNRSASGWARQTGRLP